MIGNHRVLCITLARAGSKRVPSKNTIDICGKPLIAHTLDAIIGSEFIDEAVVSTDDRSIIEQCHIYGVKPLWRPKDLAGDETTSAAAIAHVLKEFPGFDIIVEVMNTNPLKETHDIDACIKLLANTPSTSSVVSMTRVFDNHPSRVKFIQDGVLHDFYPEVPESRRQDLMPEAFVRNGSIYAFHRSNIELHGQRLVGPVVPYIMPAERTVNIDEPIDVELARIMVAQRDARRRAI